MTPIIIILLAVLGASLGSFFNVLIDRLPKKQSIVYPGSRCSECGKAIPWWLNIPVLSYVVLGGKCKYCGAKIHWHHLIVEIITPILFILLFFKFGIESFLFYKYLVLICFLIPIFLIDLFEQLILHVMSIPLIVFGLGSSLVPQSDVGIINSLLTGAVVFSLLVAITYLFAKIQKKEGMGGGDIWLMTGIACCFGFLSAPFIILIASLLGILFFAVMIRKKSVGMPFGPFLVLASVIWVFVGDVLIDKLMLKVL